MAGAIPKSKAFVSLLSGLPYATISGVFNTIIGHQDAVNLHIPALPGGGGPAPRVWDSGKKRPPCSSGLYYTSVTYIFEIFSHIFVATRCILSIFCRFLAKICLRSRGVGGSRLSNLRSSQNFFPPGSVPARLRSFLCGRPKREKINLEGGGFWI